MGAPGSRRASAAAAEADGGVRVDEHAGVGVGAGDHRAGVARRRAGRRRTPRRPGPCASGPSRRARPSRKRAISSATGRAVAAVAARTAAARGCDDTWMSMHGLSVGTHLGHRHDARSRRSGCRMSLRFDADDELRSIGAPIRRGDPAGEDVAEVAGGHAERPVGVAPKCVLRGDVVDDLRHHPRPVDRVHRRQADLVAEGRRRRTSPSPGPGSRRRCPSTATSWHVGLVDRRHLPSLHLRHPTVREQDHDVEWCRGRGRPRSRPSPCRPTWPPTMVTRSPRAVSTWSNSRPTSCSATSLNASVGPQNSSTRWRSSAELRRRARRRGGGRWRRPRPPCASKSARSISALDERAT